jgi:hypothetical protein
VVAAEKIAENILQDLFTTVLAWSLGDLCRLVANLGPNVL